jgi:hypothetical protein
MEIYDMIHLVHKKTKIILLIADPNKIIPLASDFYDLMVIWKLFHIITFFILLDFISLNCLFLRNGVIDSEKMWKCGMAWSMLHSLDQTSHTLIVIVIDLTEVQRLSV